AVPEAVAATAAAAIGAMAVETAAETAESPGCRAYLRNRAIAGGLKSEALFDLNKSKKIKV
ncbi:MAG: hypothetical protein ACT6Q9_17865, partial [Polaromonas sp.]|uniref:hypothetical protein n=1 Tax=Polaromonas sp. TaxID=1869339 RepID=UPI004035E334